MAGLAILLTNQTLASRSGTEIYVRDLARGLAQRGHRPMVFTPTHGPIAEELRRQEGHLGRTARALNTPKTTLADKVRKYGLNSGSEG